MRTEPPAEPLHRRLGTDDDDDGAPAPPGTGPEPGAEAALTRWLPESGPPRGWWDTVRADPGRAGAVALAVVGVVAVLVTVFTLIRAEEPPVASANLPAVQMVSNADEPTAAAPQQVVVSVVGLVREPGLVTLAPGARIADALDAAGGPLDGADLIGLNLARRLADGEQIVVGIAPPPGEPATVGSSVAGAPVGPAPAAPAADETGAAATGSIDLNTATEAELDTLPGIGPVTAAAIVAWRTEHGRFSSVDQLAEVDGIGPARLEKLRGRVHV